jgi:DNA-directed RNA polymerase
MLPMLEAPEPWSDINKGGYRDMRARTSHKMRFVRTHHQETVAAVRDAMRDGSMQPAVDAVNGLQAVAWTINRPVLDVVRWCYENGVDVKGLPPKGDIALPEHPKAWDTMSEDERRSWKIEFAEVKQKNRSFVSDRVAFHEDMSTADIMADKDAFWTPYNCDWRGRVYPMCHFNFQRDDRVRALFLFRDGEPLGDDGLFWLKVHVANCGDFDKISKRPLAERAAWVDTNWSLISETAANPYAATAWWTQADKPFLFLAACLEVTRLSSDGMSVRTGLSTSLPVSFDGSCSGLQHLCAMTRAPEGSLVNLTTSPLPQDVYSTVADRLVTRLEKARDGSSYAAMLHSESESSGLSCEPKTTAPASLPDKWLTFLENTNRRKVVKRNVMTYSYSSKKSGMTEQHVEDLMRPLRTKVLRKELGEHPFGDREGQWEAARFIAGHIYEAIEEIVHLPAAAMTFLQRIARAMAHESKPVRWTAPTGFPWINRYHELDVKRVELWMHDTRLTIAVAEGAKKEINRTKAANGVAPNFVHACDAAHLMLTVNASRAEGIHNIATVHDSFGCLASQATRFNAIIREQFVRMYETHDVLAEVLEQSKCDLTVHNGYRLPEVPRKGPLDLKEVINAQYAFA